MKKRLDVLVLERGLAPSREKAKTMIMEGIVFVNGQRGDKAGDLTDEAAEIEVRGKMLPYVSRGGLKLEKALAVFPIALADAVCIDIGSSTGGFTDCMLQNGAAKVYAIDSGRGQLAWSLRSDTRVICMEKTNFRYLTEEALPEKADFASADVSFISLKKILPPAFALLKDDGEMVCLIKPQFEAGKEKVGKKGVVRDKGIHREVITEIAAFSKETGFFPTGLSFSPIKGPEGNIEYLLYLRKRESEAALPEIADVVEAAHEELARV